ncbi:MAG: hypothetical protein K0R00_2462 [Herbinix sp.]|nr:hypothetical protein [Herbinix sp.]
MKHNKNFTMYWMIGVSAILTIPLAVIVYNRVLLSSLAITAIIMGIFLVLFFSIMILYKSIFKVSVQEITQEDKVTELDSLYYHLEDQIKVFRNEQLVSRIKRLLNQIQIFKRRKKVLSQLIDVKMDMKGDSSLSGLIPAVEKAMLVNVQMFINRLEIFDEYGLPDYIIKNIDFMEEQLIKNNNILNDFETLITEISRMNEIKVDSDMTRLKDVVNAMQSLRLEDDEVDELAKKYNQK